MKILTINEAFTGNIGDKAINFCLKNLLQERFVEATIFEESYTGKPDMGNGNKPKSNISKKVRQILKSILPQKATLRTLWLLRNAHLIAKHRKQRYDLVVIGGGALIDGYWLFPFVFWFWTFLFKTTQSSKIIVFAIGYGRDMSSFDKLMIKKALKRVDEIYLRDIESIKRFKNDYGITAKFVPDVAFTISRFVPSALNFEKRITVFPLNYEMYKREMVKANESYIDKRQYLDDWIEGIKTYYDKGYQIVFSSSEPEDLPFLNEVRLEVEELNLPTTVSIPQNLEELLIQISSSAVILSGRMHPLIIGYSYGCECLSYPLYHKIRNFKQEILEGNKDRHALSNKVLEVVRGLD